MTGSLENQGLVQDRVNSELDLEKLKSQLDGEMSFLVGQGLSICI